MFGFDKDIIKLFKNLNTPSKVQDFIEDLEINFERDGESCMSPLMVLKTGKAHCIEAALLAAVILRVNGHSPLIVDLEANDRDFDHVITVFKSNGYWGAISKTNRGVLKYRDPIYKSIRELVLSYFNEYILNDGKKTLRTYSSPVDLSKFDDKNWMTSEEDVWFIPEYLTTIKHFPILDKKQIHNLRRADPIEVEVGRITLWNNGEKVVKNEFEIDENPEKSI
jgi:hypothetical protein